MRRNEKELTFCQRYNRTFSIIMIDIDNFKHVNNIQGHRAGDRVIQMIGKLLITHSRNNDLVARYGGEEFIWLLPETNAKAASLAAEKACFKIRDRKIKNGKEPLQMTASLGVAQRELQSDQLSSVVERADNALYQAKKRGKDQVVIWE